MGTEVLLSSCFKEKYNLAAHRGEGMHRAKMFPTAVKILGESGTVGIIIARGKERE